MLTVTIAFTIIYPKNMHNFSKNALVFRVRITEIKNYQSTHTIQERKKISEKKTKEKGNEKKQ